VVQTWNRNDRPRRSRSAKYLRIDPVEVRPILHADQVGGYLEDIIETTSRFGKYRLQIGDRLSDLFLEGSIGGVAAVPALPKLSRNEDQVAPGGPLRIMSGRCRDGSGGNGLDRF